MKPLLLAFLLIIVVALIGACLSVTESFGVKCPAFTPIHDDPVIADRPKPPSIGLSDKPI